MGLETGAREGVDDGGIGDEGVATEGVTEGEEEEAEGQVGLVAEAEGYLGEFGGGEAGGVEGADFVPP